MRINPDSVVTPVSTVAFREVSGQMVLVSTRDNRVLTLNETGSVVWRTLDGRSVAAVASAIVDEFDVAYEQALEETVGFIEALAARSLVVEGSASEDG